MSILNTFWPNSELWPHGVGATCTLRAIWHWGIVRYHLKSSQLKRFGLTIITCSGGSKKPFFCVWCTFLEEPPSYYLSILKRTFERLSSILPEVNKWSLGYFNLKFFNNLKRTFKCLHPPTTVAGIKFIYWIPVKSRHKTVILIGIKMEIFKSNVFQKKCMDDKSKCSVWIHNWRWLFREHTKRKKKVFSTLRSEY